MGGFERLEKALAEIKANFKDESVLIGNEIPNVERIPTGSIGLDYVTGGGYPVGRFIEIYSPESGGKTTVCIHAMVEAQKKYKDKRVLFVDFEHSFDRYYAQALGLDLDNLVFVQPNSGENGFNMIETIVKSGQISLVIVDSIAAATPQSEIEGDVGDSNVGKHARMMSQICRKLTAVCNNMNTTMIFINQLREKIGIMYGDSTTTTGGNAMKFYASVRLKFTKKKGSGTDDDGNLNNIIVKAKAEKNKVAPPFRECEYDILFGKGIDKASEVLHYAVELGLVKRGGSWFSYGDTKLGQGAETVKGLLRDNPELMEEIETNIRCELFKNK